MLLWQKPWRQGIEIDPVQDYNYDYRQGTFADPFGHQWVVEKKIG